MKLSPFLLASLLLPAAACDVGDLEEDNPNAIEELNVAGGAREIDETSWAAIGVLKVAGSCTAVAIGPRKVLTAAHCFDSRNSGDNRVTGSELDGVYFDQRGGVGRVYATAVAIEPNYHPDERYNRYDIAVVTVDDDLSPTMPISRVTPKKDSWFVGVGYGYSSEEGNDFGTKRSFVNQLDEIDPHHLQYDKKTSRGDRPVHCYGDSGGPLMQYSSGRYRVRGISSRKRGKNCKDADAYYARVDLSYDWIRDQL